MALRRALRAPRRVTAVDPITALAPVAVAPWEGVLNLPGGVQQIERAAETRPAVPSSPVAIAGGPSEEEQEMGIFSFLGKVASAGIGVAEGITGIDVPFVGPGDRFLGTPIGRAPAVPGGRGPLDVQGLPTLPTQSLMMPRPQECGFGFVWDAVRQQCVPGLGTRPGSDRPPPTGTAVATTGMHNPFVVQSTRRECLTGHVLDRNGVCVDKRTIRNSDRMYPKPRRPLLTGGDLKCIATASRAASRMKTQTKRLQKLGMLPKPGRR